MSAGSDCDAPPLEATNHEDLNPFAGADASGFDGPHLSKRRKATPRRVVCVPADGKSKGDGPPSDAWAWRKYGQKPIKGSPHPRGYYRCSSHKGCPARKQVERSRSDPAMLVITYAFSHNHPLVTASGKAGADAHIPEAQAEAEQPPNAGLCVSPSKIEDDDEDLFADLGELPEASSAVNGRGSFFEEGDAQRTEILLYGTSSYARD